MIRLETDPCVYRSEDYSVYLLIHVDDILILSKPNSIVKDKIIDALKDKFKITITKQMKSFLSFAIDYDHSNQTIEINQAAYVETKLKEFNIYDKKYIPAASGSSLRKIEKNEITVKSMSLPTLVGSLNCAAIMTRPDIGFSFGYISRFQKTATKSMLITRSKSLLT